MQVQGTRASGFGPEIADTTLVKAVLAGDRDAFGELYWRHFDGVAGYVCRRVPPHGPREDLVQEAFTLALERLEEFREDAAEYDTFGQWLCGIAGYVLAQERKSYWRGRRAHEVSVDALARELRDGPALPGGEVELSAEMTAKVAQLPPKQRRVIALHYVEGHSVEQTAAITGAPAGWVRRNIVAALKQLRPAEVTARRSQRQGALTRARLVEAARQVIAEHGLRQASRRAIAERVEVSVHAINFHFGSLAALLSEAHGVTVTCRTGVRPAVAA